jgi:tRNA(Ile)-lysidine synthase
VGLQTGTENDRIGEAMADAFRSRLLPNRGSVLVAVSGGQDSLALLHATLASAPKDVDVCAAHVDHGLRPSSASDAAHVARTARNLGARIVQRRYNVERWLAGTHANLEGAARSVRYRLLHEISQTLGGCPVITGHTGDDQVETVLLHLLRGAGAEGLVGLQPRQNFPVTAFGPTPPRLGRIKGELTLIRPLLDVERWETAAYCERHGLRWILDESNADVTLTRNRIRHHLVPLLETYNPSVRLAIRRLASLVRDDIGLIETVVEQEWQTQARVNASSVSIDLETFLAYQRAVASRLLRRSASYLESQVTLSFEQVNRCMSLAFSGSGTTRLPGNLQWRVSNSTVDIIRLSDTVTDKDAERTNGR